MNWPDALRNPVAIKIAGTLVLVACVFGLHLAVVRVFQQREGIPRRVRRRWMVTVRNTAFVLMVAGIVTIWYQELQAVAAVIVVFAVAFVLATKELWLNVTGFFFRNGTHFFSVGDRIEIGDFRGDVVDQRFSGVTVLEIGPGSKSHQYSGRSVFIPNSKFLSSPVVNETYMKDYVFHIITVPIKTSTNWQKAEQALLEAANEVCSPYLEKARQHMKALEQQHSLDAPGVEPRVQIQLPEPERINLVLRFPIPARRRGRLEQELIRRHLVILEQLTAADEAGAKSDSESRATSACEVHDVSEVESATSHATSTDVKIARP